MIRFARRASCTVYGSLVRSSDISATSAVSMATSVPAAPMTTATLDVARAGASLTPSPTMATVPYSLRNAVIAALLSEGISSARTLSMPSWSAIERATRSRSPVSIVVCAMPRERSPVDRGLGLGSQLVRDAEKADQGTVGRDGAPASRRPARSGQAQRLPRGPCCQSATRPTAIRRPSTVASAPPPDGRVVRGPDFDAAVTRGACDDRIGDRVRRGAFDRGGQPQEFAVVVAVQRVHGHQGRAPRGSACRSCRTRRPAAWRVPPGMRHP